MSFISDNDWLDYKAIVDEFAIDASKDVVLWEKHIGSIPLEGSDEDTVYFEDPIPLNCLVSYNAFRTWPLTNYTQTGEEDKQSEVVYINLSYLDSLNLLDTNGNFAYNADKDRFTHKGILYYDAGHTPVAQAGSSPLFHIMVLKRVDIDNQINGPVNTDSDEA